MYEVINIQSLQIWRFLFDFLLSLFKAPISTYKFSRPISVHYFEELVERICLKIKAFPLGDNLINSHTV